MTITADQIITLLKTGVYPTPYPAIQYYKYKQKFTNYPSIEVVRAQPDSYQEDVVKRDRNFQFEIRLYIKYILLPDQELINQASIEDTISGLLLGYDFQGQQKIFQESIGWTRTDLTGGEGSVYGSMSSVRLGVKDVTSTDGLGYVGAYNIIELNSDTTPVQIQLLNSTFNDGSNLISHADDAGQISRDPGQFNPGDYSITYENTAALDPLIKTMSNHETGGVAVKGRLIKGNTIYNYLFLIGSTVKSGGYSEIERGTTKVTVEGTWT